MALRGKRVAGSVQLLALLGYAASAVHVAAAQECGNGIVEGTEQCECKGPGNAGTSCSNCENCAETWSKLGDGYCFAGGEQQEKEYMLTDWTIKTLESAKEACEADLACVGIHYDQWAQSKPDEGDYVLLNRLGTPNNNMAVRRSCYKLRENPELPGCNSDGFIQQAVGNCPAGTGFIETDADCAAAGTSLGLPDTATTVTEWQGGPRQDRPHGCYFYKYPTPPTIHVNPGGNKEFIGDWERVSLCTCTPTAAPTDMPTAAPTAAPTDAPTDAPAVIQMSFDTVDVTAMSEDEKNEFKVNIKAAVTDNSDLTLADIERVDLTAGTAARRQRRVSGGTEVDIVLASTVTPESVKTAAAAFTAAVDAGVNIAVTVGGVADTVTAVVVSTTAEGKTPGDKTGKRGGNPKRGKAHPGSAKAVKQGKRSKSRRAL